jgi:hypothetical protein
MRPLASVALVLLVCSTLCAPASAQQSPSRIGPFVVDLRGTFPAFPSNTQLADSRGLAVTDLPGAGLGVDLGAHLYLVRWRAVTFGVGGELMIGRAHSTPPPAVPGQIATGHAVTEHFTTISPQISFNFGKSTGWSYLSAGIGQSIWSIVPDGAASQPADEERLKTLNYGGGARWFAKKHLAFTFDVRFYAISPGTPQFGFKGGSPHTSLLVIGAGVSVR